MAYNHKFVTNAVYQFYNNSETLEDDANFNYWTIKLVHSDSFVPVTEDFVTLAKDIISGTDYRWYTDAFYFPDVEKGCYRMVIESSISGLVLYISNEIDVVTSDEGLMVWSYRNAKNIMNYNYEVLTSFRNVFHVECFNRKPLSPTEAEGYPLADGTFQRVSTTKLKTYEFVTGWFDETEHDATEAATIHSSLKIGYGGNFNDMSNNSEYEIEWQENYEYIEASFRLQEIDKASFNKAI